MKKSIHSLETIFNLNQRLFNNTLAGVSEEQAQERISSHNNPMNWLAAHTVWARYLMLMFLGKPVANPYASLFDNFKAYDASLDYPSLQEARQEWQKASGLLKEAVESVTEEHLAAEAPIKNPSGDFTNGGTLAFLAQHESYTIGQMSLLKKYLTKEPMSYN
jgi:uncharacterized damage-inducible protein DinB